MDELFTIAPRPCVSIWGISYFMHNHTPARLVRMTRSHSSAVVSTMGEVL
jgi:hypothetical protein